MSYWRIALTGMVAVVLWVTSSQMAEAIEGVWHDPYGMDDLYEVAETERYPRDPIVGEEVYIKLTTWPIEPGQATWVSWKKNGEEQPNRQGEWKYNQGNNSYWEVALGSFEKGDKVEYTVYGNQHGGNEQQIGSFEFVVTDWDYLASVERLDDQGDRLIFTGESRHGLEEPKLNLSFQSDSLFRVQASPTGREAKFSGGTATYNVEESDNTWTIETDVLRVVVEKAPFQLLVYNKDTGEIITRSNDGEQALGWLTDGDFIYGFNNEFHTPENEEFYGFGERYNSLGQRGNNVDTYVYNQYLNQDERTYTAIPFFVNSNNYGLFLNSTFYSQFRLATDENDVYSFQSHAEGNEHAILDYYVIHGDNMMDVIEGYTSLTGKPGMLPKYAFGLWMSANEWNSQQHVDDVLANVEEHDIPASVMVLEQWSDEQTFYIWNDATYEPKDGGDSFSYDDFTFQGRWPDPKGMVRDIHDQGIRVLMWQIPVQKWSPYDYEQADLDEAFMIEQGYAVGDGENGQYRIPPGQWFENSLLPDFTNESATNWWMEKRNYLFDDIGIDGFKTDGGEMVWGRNNTFSNGKTGDEMRNQYPNEYIRAYHDFAKSKKDDSILFSRAGTHGIQKYPGLWAGDQDSTFNAYQQAIRAGLSVNASGVPFWGWDMAGFTGDYPTAELYKRSTSMSAFTPLMQFHSEKAAPTPSEERSPWNAVERTGDDSILDTFRFYTNTRMNLLPYIYNEALYSADTGVPLMRAMALQFGEDEETHALEDQYMFGSQLLVAPIMEEGATTKEVYLPEGEWIDLWWGAKRPGNQWITYQAGVDDIPVFVKAGSILPLNLNESFELGGSVGNEMNDYDNLTYRIYPKGETELQWFDEVEGAQKTIRVNEDAAASTLAVTVPEGANPVTLQVFSGKAEAVTVGGTSLTQYDSLAQWLEQESGWYYDTQKQLIHISLPASTDESSVLIEGVSQAAYEAEFAQHQEVGTNSNHEGFTGTGFVDQFESVGDSITFNVYAKEAKSYQLGFRYSAAVDEASRTIYVNGERIDSLLFPRTGSWNEWELSFLNVDLTEGANDIRIEYSQGDYAGINVDHLTIQ